MSGTAGASPKEKPLQLLPGGNPDRRDWAGSMCKGSAVGFHANSFIVSDLNQSCKHIEVRFSDSLLHHRRTTELRGARHPVVLAAAQHQIGKTVSDVRVFVLVGCVSESFLSRADCHALEEVPAAQSFPQHLAGAIDDQARLPIDQSLHGTSSGFPSDLEVVASCRLRP